MRRLLLLRPWMITSLFMAVYLFWVLANAGGDVTTFVTIDPVFARCDGSAPAGYVGGYDGQFAYFIARDPLTAAGCLDVPAYRMQRILLPMAGRLLAFGMESLLPITMIVVNLGVFVASVAVFEHLLVEQRVSRWYALVYGLFAGMVLAVRLNTSEPLSYGLVVIAIWLGQRNRLNWEVLAWVGAVLAKETALVFVVGLLLSDLLHRRWRHALILGMGVGAMFAGWQLVLYGWLGAFGVGSGGAGGSSFEIIPFGGLWRIGSGDQVLVLVVLALFAVPMVVIPSVWGLVVAGREVFSGRPHPYAAYLFLNGLMMWTLPNSTFREPLGLMRVMVGLVIAYLLYMGMRKPRGRAMRYSLIWFALLVYLQAG